MGGTVPSEKPQRSVLLDADFLKIWIGQSVSYTGSQISALAIPLVAVVALKASAVELGVLTFSSRLPALVFSLVAGAWLDRRRRRPALIAADLSRAVLLVAIPIGAWTNRLTLALLMAVGFGVGTFTVVSELGYQSYLPGLVARNQLLEANSRFELTRSVADVSGPGLAGLLVQFLSAPAALLIDSASYLVSAACLFGIGRAEPRPERRAGSGQMLDEIKRGFFVVWRHEILRPLIAAAATFNLFVTWLLTLYVLFLVHDLRLPPSQIGLTFTAFGAGAVIGTLIAPRALGFDHLGRVMLAAAALAVSGIASIALVGTSTLAVLRLSAAMGVFGVGLQIYNIASLTIRQSVSPAQMLGRVNATGRFFSWSAAPLGGLLAGVLGAILGLRAAIALAAVGSLMAVVILVLSPVVYVRRELIRRP